MTEHQNEAGGSRGDFDENDMMDDRGNEGIEQDFLDDIDELVEEEIEAEEIDLAAEASKAGFSSPAEFLAAEIEKLEGEKAELKDQYRAHPCRNGKPSPSHPERCQGCARILDCRICP